MTKILEFFKKHWRTLLEVIGVIAAAVGAILFFSKRQQSAAEDISSLNAAHDEEIKKIEAIRAEERKQHEENERVLREELEAAQKKYDADIVALDDKKKREAEALVQKHGADPVELAKKLAEKTGFVVVLPQEKK